MTFTSKPEIPVKTFAPPTSWPRRIACITSETTEIVFALGAGERIIGVSGYAVRPPEARLKEKIAAFKSIRMDKVRELKPDLVLGFSDLQNDIARQLVEEGFNVFITNQRTLQQTADALLAIARLIGEEAKGREIYENFLGEIDSLASQTTALLKSRPRVYFEEWDDPMITGISWVHELIERLGGEDVFAHKSSGTVAKQRTVTSDEVMAADPDLIIASWCGKKVQFEKIRSRPGWEKIRAVRENRLYEIKSPDILAPGLSLIHGARQMAEIFSISNKKL